MNKAKDQLKTRINTMARLIQDSNIKIYSGLINYLVNLFMSCYSEIYFRPNFLTEDINTAENFMLMLNLFSDKMGNMLNTIKKDFKTYTIRARSITELHAAKISLNYNLNNTEGLKRNFTMIEDTFKNHFSPEQQNKFSQGVDKEFDSFAHSYLNLVLEFVDPNYQTIIRENKNVLTKNSHKIAGLAKIKLKQTADSDIELESVEVAKEFTCPLTKGQIEDGCVSIKCGHYYDKNAIEASINHEPAKKLPCPNTGCDKIISLSDLTKLYSVDIGKEIRKFSYIRGN